MTWPPNPSARTLALALAPAPAHHVHGLQCRTATQPSVPLLIRPTPRLRLRAALMKATATMSEAMISSVDTEKNSARAPCVSLAPPPVGGE